jgi:DNA-binding NtrC family response regulator
MPTFQEVRCVSGGTHMSFGTGFGEDSVTEGSESLVLLVDDEKSILDLLSMWLKTVGFRTMVASSVQEAMEKFRQTAVNVVVSDLYLGTDPDGFAVLDAIRGEGRNVPVIMMSGTTNAGVREEALARGAYAFLAKPFGPESLLHLITDALGSTLSQNR